MDEKMSWTVLRKALASRAGVSEKTAGTFLTAFQTQLVAALKSDKQVKINGLGTFKVQAVAPRKSVNIKTGEEIVIEGYNKLVFVPEAGVKELVEKGEVRSETAAEPAVRSEVIDPIKKLGEQAEEIVGLLGELGQSPNQVKSEEPAPEPVEPKALEPEAIEPAVLEPKVEEPKVEEPEPVVQEPEVKHKEPKKHHFWRDTLICVIILMAILVAGYFFLRHEMSAIIRSLVQPTEQVEKVEPAAIVEEPAVLEPETVEVEEPEAIEPTVVAEEPKKIEYQIITVEPMHKASRLTWMAKRYYGKKVYWPYIYDANRDKIANPNHIEAGTPIRVPKLTKAMRDTTSVTFIQLKQEAEAACR